MKLLKTYLIAVLAFAALSLNAQFYVGGGLGLSTSGGSQTVGSISADKTSRLSFDFYPEAGYFLSQNFAAGLGLYIGTSKITSPGTPEVITKTNSFGFFPYVKYYAVRMDKFSIYGRGELGFFFDSESTKVDGTTSDGPKSTTVSVGVAPGVAYELNEHIILEALIDLLYIGYSQTTEKEDVDDVEMKDKSTSFNFGGGFDLGSIVISAIYRF
jgi:hypothetical protein